MTDKELRREIKRHMHQDPGNPFFTRKVLNRLPERQKGRIAWLVPAALACALLVLVGCWWNCLTTLSFSLSNWMPLLLLWSLTLLWVYSAIRVLVAND